MFNPVYEQMTIHEKICYVPPSVEADVYATGAQEKGSPTDDTCKGRKGA